MQQTAKNQVNTSSSNVFKRDRSSSANNARRPPMPSGYTPQNRQPGGSPFHHRDSFDSKGTRAPQQTLETQPLKEVPSSASIIAEMHY